MKDRARREALTKALLTPLAVMRRLETTLPDFGRRAVRAQTLW